MSDAAYQLLANFDALPVKEQHEVLVEILRRCRESTDGIVSDDQLVGIADELFQVLDAKESDGDDADTR